MSSSSSSYPSNQIIRDISPKKAKNDNILQKPTPGEKNSLDYVFCIIFSFISIKKIIVLRRIINDNILEQHTHRKKSIHLSK